MEVQETQVGQLEISTKSTSIDIILKAFAALKTLINLNIEVNNQGA